MHKVLRERRNLVARHDLDGLLPSAAVRGDPARLDQLADLAELANREIPGVCVSEAALAQFLRQDPESVFAFQRNGKLLGGVAFLYLNRVGHDALLLDEIDLKHPNRQLLARPDEDVSAIYTWALVGHGRATMGLGNVTTYLRRPRFLDADHFARPSSAAGRALLIALGFGQIANCEHNLWTYQRPWNRLSPPMPASFMSAGSYPDVRP
jgi:hypothetical protein